MKKLPLLLSVLGFVMFGGVMPAWCKPAASITVCDDDAERPPFLYYQRQYGVKTDKLTGFAVEVLRKILAQRGVSYSLELLPWKRCLASVQEGRIDMVLSASRNEEREQSLVFSQPLYHSRLVYFFDSELEPPRVAKREDVLKYKVCTVTGVNYAPFGLSPNSPNIAGTAKTLGQTFLMLKSRRCQLVPARLEGAIGYRLLGLADYEQLGLSFAPMPDRQNATQSMHFGVSAKSPQAEALVTMLNAGLEQLKASGALMDLSDRFGMGRLP